MGRYLFAIAIAFAWLAALSGPARAHGGGLNAEGCHNDRKNGGYHCHRGPRVPLPSAPDGYAPRNNLTDSGSDEQNGDGGAFRNCTAARAAGAAPVRRGDPGYGSHLDRDGDGVGCE
jgi:hypothetical protein